MHKFLVRSISIVLSHRLSRVNELIKQVVGQIILETEDFESGVLVTIMAVETSLDLQHAKVTISVYPTQKSKQILGILNAHIFGLQQLLNKKLQMRPVPKIRFVLNKAEIQAQQLDELLQRQPK